MNKVFHKNNAPLSPCDGDLEHPLTNPSISFSSLFDFIENIDENGVSFDTNLFD